MYLNHVTINTGHLARHDASKVSTVVLDALVPWLLAALKTDQPCAIPGFSEFFATAKRVDGGLLVKVYSDEDVPIVAFGVARQAKNARKLWDTLVKMASKVSLGTQYPSEPWCAAALLEAAPLFMHAITWIADFEKCVALTFLDKRMRAK